MQQLTTEINELFDEKGMAKHDKSTYFNEDGELINYYEIWQSYSKYPADSDLVKMFFAEHYASETRQNYDARTLYKRAF